MLDISIIICVDVDPDGFNVPGTKLDKKRDGLSWRGLEERIPLLIDFLNTVKDSHGGMANLSWFLRCDDQINEMYGEYGWLLINYNRIWKTLRERGDEISWHPHFFRWFDEKVSWNQETQDVDWMLRCLENGFNAFCKLTGNIPSVRTGWAFHNNQTMKKLNELGVKADLSAVPSFKSNGRLLSGIFCDNHDWSTTSGEPYFPSESDYRVPGGDSLGILEIPMTVAPDPFPYSLFGMVVDNRLKSPPPKFHLTPVKEPKKFSGIIRNEIKAIKKEHKKRHIGMYFHPTDFFSENAMNNFNTNLTSLLEIMRKEKVDFSFCTAKQTATLILNEIK